MIKRLILILLLLSSKAYAGFGDMCSAPTGFLDFENLRNNSAYGFVVDNIDMTKAHVPAEQACSAELVDEISLCVRNPEADPVCELYTIKLGEKKKLFKNYVNDDVKFLQDIEFYVKAQDGNLCLYMPTAYGEAEIGCKSLANQIQQPDVIRDCRIAQSCFETSKHSRWTLPFSGKAIECMSDSFDHIFYGHETCLAPGDDDSVISSFSSMQMALRKIVLAAILLYIIFVGFTVVLEPSSVNVEFVATKILAVVLVTYFSVGIGEIVYEGGTRIGNNGMTELVVPFLINMTSEFANMVFSAGGSQGLCHFDPADYDAGYGYYALWDSIDCRIAYYFGAVPIGASDVTAENSFAFVFFQNIILLIIGGQFIIALSMLVFGIFFLSILLNFITSYMACVISIYGLSYLAPIFVPMSLFSQTKGYFQAWWKLLLSFALQPAVLAVFIALMMTIFDDAIYGNCIFKGLENNGLQYYNILLPSAEPEKCTGSVGYILQTMFFGGENIESKNFILFILTIAYIPNPFFLFDVLRIMILGIFFYFFSNQMNRFAADLTDGISVDKMSLSPTALFDKAANKAMSKIGSKNKDKGSKDRGGGASDKISSGSGAKDKIAGGDGD